MRAYVLTRLDSGIPIHGLYATPLLAAQRFNSRYFGEDALPGGPYADMYGWEPYDIEKHGDQQTDGLPDGADAWIFSDEGDAVFIVGLEIQG
jgi:hypothetical protein